MSMPYVCPHAGVYRARALYTGCIPENYRFSNPRTLRQFPARIANERESKANPSKNPLALRGDILQRCR